ncbi:endoribonuclease YbeY [Ktedonobacteria bacterium brp13]|nr:endoribonuclease YbeY [Ktedonobacteria bacterium brp13]
MQEHPLIELYVTHSDEAQNAFIEQAIAKMNLDGVVFHTLNRAGIAEPVMLTVMITDDDGIREMNKQYREQDKATDVLSFPLQEQPLVHAPADQLWSRPEGEETPIAECITKEVEAIEDENADENEEDEGTPNTHFVNPPGMVMNLGDIVISWPTILHQAAQAGHDYQTELMYLLSHGVLHLIGYDDQTEAGYQAMVALQQQVLQELGQKAYRHESINEASH